MEDSLKVYPGSMPWCIGELLGEQPTKRFLVFQAPSSLALVGQPDPVNKKYLKIEIIPLTMKFRFGLESPIQKHKDACL